MGLLRITLFLTVLTGLLTIGASAQSLKKAPELDLKDLQGLRIKLSNYHGKILLLNFWATWCPPCRTEIPDLIRMQKQYRREGLQIIGITYPPQTTAQVRSFVKRRRVNYRIALGTKSSKELFDDSDALPITVIIDREGNVREVIKGILYPDEFEGKIRPLLNARSH